MGYIAPGMLIGVCFSIVSGSCEQVLMGEREVGGWKGEGVERLKIGNCFNTFSEAPSNSGDEDGEQFYHFLRST